MKYFIPLLALSLLQITPIYSQNSNHSQNSPYEFNDSGTTTIIPNQEYIITPFQEHPDIIFLEKVNHNTAVVKFKNVRLPYECKIAHYPISRKIQLDIENFEGNEVVVFLRKQHDILSAQVALKGFTVAQYISAQAYIVKINKKEDIPLLAELKSVQSIAVKPNDESLNYDAHNITNTSVLIQPPLYGGNLGLSGRQIHIGIGDDSNPNHLDLNDKSTKFSPINQTSHGSHVSGIVAGSGLINELYTGYAPNSKIYNHYYSYVLEFTPNLVSDYQINLTNNSYGANLNNCFYLGIYDATSRAVDALALSYPSVLHVFAAGNSRQRTCNGLPYGYGTLAGHYQTSKNVLTVANIGKTITTYNQTSSVGPTQDGRLKPEITAIGNAVTSTGNNNNYFGDNGTSMSAPGVTGAAALLSEYYKSVHNTTPDAALLKTVLMAGTEDIANIGPDYVYGFGLMDVMASYNILKNNQYRKQETITSNNRTFEINVPNHIAKLNVMLYWADSVTSVAATNPLFADLDLKVIDPNNSTHFPWILDPANPNLPATKGADHVNNVEQVTIDYPAAGRYIVDVSNYMPNNGAHFYVAYHLEVDTATLKFPFGGERIIAGATHNIYWKSTDTINTFSLAISTDNGASWNPIVTNINAKQRHYNYAFPNVNNTSVKLKLTQNNKDYISNTFSIIGRPVITLDNTNNQCPCSIKINWTAINGIDTFVAYRYAGNDDMTAVDTIINQNTYTYTNLSPDTTYWVGLVGIKNKIPSIRSVGLNRRPNTGNCNNFDVIATKILKKNGRKFTHLAYSSNEQLPIYLISNYNTAIANAPNFSVSINNQTLNHNASSNLAARFQGIYNIPNVDLSDTGTYQIQAVLLLNDSNISNNTAATQLKHWSNEPLIFTDSLVIDFEGEQINLVGDTTIGIDAQGRFDFEPYPNSGRIRSFVSSNITINGAKSLTIDHNAPLARNITTDRINRVIGTFNFSSFDTNDDIRLSFKYRLTERPKFSNNNAFYIRANDTATWHKILDFEYDSLQPQRIYHVENIQLTRVLAGNNEFFNSSSFQIMFEHNDTANTGGIAYGNGLTIDDIVFIKVKNDLVLDSVTGFDEHLCINTGADSMYYHIRNLSNNDLYQINYGYNLNHQPLSLGIIDSLGAFQDTVIATPLPSLFFNNDSFAFTSWIHHPTDTYANNDSIWYQYLYNFPKVTVDQYLERFEQNNHRYYARGENSSWILLDDGSDTTDRISSFYQSAASGQKAWKTGLHHYNNNEESYLYAPCLDLSNMQEPMLSFHLFNELHQNDSINNSDQFSVEICEDGINWIPLNANTMTYRWATHPGQTWQGNDGNYWHVVTCRLPRAQTIGLRFKLVSDYNQVGEGIAIDDVHIYEKGLDIGNPNITVSKNINTSTPNKDSLIHENNIYFSIEHNGDFSESVITGHPHDYMTDTLNTQYIYPQHITLKPEIDKNATVNWYLKDSAFHHIELDTTCITCPRPYGLHHYSLSIYNDKSAANSWHTDNDPSKYIRIAKDQYEITPYLDGYILTLNTDKYGEYWLHYPSKTQQHINDTILLLDGQWQGIYNCSLELFSEIEDNVSSNYLLYVSRNGNPDELIHIFTRNNTGYYSDWFPTSLADSVFTYHVKYQLHNGEILRSNEVTLKRDAFADTVMILPNPTKDDINVYIIDRAGNPLKVAIYNAIGQLVHQEALTQQKTVHYTYSFIQNNQAKGIYLLLIYIGEQKHTYKIVYE